MIPGYESKIGSTNSVGRFAASIAGIVGASNILSLIIGEDVITDGGGNITTFKARYGTSSTPVAAGRAVKSVVLNRVAGVFSASSDSQAYTALSNTLTQIAVCRYDGTMPFPSSQGIITANAAPSIQSNLATNSFNPLGTLYRDGLATAGANLDPHIWECTNATGSASTYYMGNLFNQVARNWIGPIWLACQLSIQLDSTQRTNILQLVKGYYPFITS